jgi:alpha-mannosidase
MIGQFTAFVLLKVLDENVPARGKLLYALDQAFKLLDTREPFGEAFYTSVASAHAALRSGLAQAGAPLDVHVGATGHAHIDVAWLWTLGQTRPTAFGADALQLVSTIHQKEIRRE